MSVWAVRLTWRQHNVGGVSLFQQTSPYLDHTEKYVSKNGAGGKHTTRLCCTGVLEFFEPLAYSLKRPNMKSNLSISSFETCTRHLTSHLMTVIIKFEWLETDITWYPWCETLATQRSFTVIFSHSWQCLLTPSGRLLLWGMWLGTVARLPASMSSLCADVSAAIVTDQSALLSRDRAVLVTDWLINLSHVEMLSRLLIVCSKK